MRATLANNGLNLFMEPTDTLSLSESTYGPPDHSNILPSDEKNDISV